MTKEKLNDIKGTIAHLKTLNVEQFTFILKYYLNTWIKSALSFGPYHDITKDVNNAFKELCSIHKEESLLLNFILYKSAEMNYEEVVKFMDIIDAKNDETILYYVKAFEDIMSASETEQEFRAVRPAKGFTTLIDTMDYRKELYGLVLKLDDIKNFLNYPKEFWEYIMPKVRVIDDNQDKCMNPEVIMKFDNKECLEDIRVIVPHIINLTSALINVHEFQHAYDLYLLLGKIVPYSNEYYENIAKNKEENFKNEYVLKLIK